MYIPFYTKFPFLSYKNSLLASPEGDSVAVSEENYIFFESYCAEKDCDCRRVIIQVVNKNNFNEILATIGYGWESVGYYRNYLKNDEYFSDEELIEPCLEPDNTQTNLSPVLLGIFQRTLNTHKGYKDIFRRHYGLFKKAVNDEISDCLRGINGNIDIYERGGNNAQTQYLREVFLF